MQNLSLLSGAMTQPFVASAPAKLCDLASPVSNGSGNNVAAHITNTLEFAGAPVLKFNQVVNTHVRAQQAIVGYARDVLQVSHEP